MTTKTMVSISIVAAIVLVIIFAPGILLLPVALFDQLKSRFSSESTLSGTGKHLTISTSTIQESNWGTGTKQTKSEYHILLNGKVLKSEQLNEALGSEGEYSFAHNLRFLDAKELAPDEILVITPDDEQDGSNPVFRIYIENELLKIQALSFNSKGSYYSFFPPSRASGWLQILGHDMNRWFIKSSPFVMINIGPGVVAKVETPYVFLAEVNSADTRFRVFNLDSQKQESELLVSSEALATPDLDFDYPESETRPKDSQTVPFSAGPKWWDEHIEFNKETKTLKFKKKK